MAIATYNITKIEILYYLPQFNVSGNTVPNSDQIDDHFLTRAATDIAEALKDGGFGLTPTVSATVNEYAYQKIRNTIMERAALYFAAANMHLFNTDSVNDAWQRNDSILLSFSRGDTICELEPEEGYGSSKFYYGDTDSIDDLDAARFSYLNDML